LASSSTSISRSSLGTSSQIKAPEGEAPKGHEIPALPFIICSLHSTWNTFLHFSPGAFCRYGTLVGSGANFAVEKHSLKGKRGSLLVDPFKSAENPWNPTYVAVKKVRRVSSDPGRVFQALERELIALRFLVGHQNVLQLLGVGWEPSPIHGDSRLWPALVVEFAQHGTLADLQRKAGALFYETKRKFCLDIANGLHAIHSVGLVHGDVKSENVLVMSDEKEGYIAKISDLGFSSTITRVRTDGLFSPFQSHQETFVVAGTTELWAAPDSKDAGDFPTLMSRDVYSWGMLVIRVILDGKFPLKDIQNGLKKIPITEGWSPTVHRCTAKDMGKATLSRRQHSADIRPALHAQREDRHIKSSPIASSGSTGEAEATFSDDRGNTRFLLERLKCRGRDSMVQFASCSFRDHGEKDVVEAIPTLQRVLTECLDVKPAGRSLPNATKAWA
jgi:serine/threonine protein kinase